MKPKGLGLLGAMSMLSMLGTVEEKDAVFGINPTPEKAIADPALQARIEDATSRAERRRLEKAEAKRLRRVGKSPVATEPVQAAMPQTAAPSQPFKNRGRS